MPLEMMVKLLVRLGWKHGLLHSGSAHTFHLSGLHVQLRVGRRASHKSKKQAEKAKFGAQEGNVSCSRAVHGAVSYKG